MKIAPYIQEAVLRARASINRAIDSRWDNHPFGRTPHATREQYLTWFQQTKDRCYPQIDELEARLGYAIERDWINELALHTQIVKKKSPLNYSHGRLLYSLLRRMIADRHLGFVTVLETGTARGFSAVCMAKALADSNCDGRILTLDVLSHHKRQIWNCIDDHDGPKSRAEILAPWENLTRKITFVQGDTQYILPRLGIDRINFAFLDAQHIESSVLHEFSIVSDLQKAGDMIVFDDVSEHAFAGVAKAVSLIEKSAPYSVERLLSPDGRGYAWATCNR